MSSRNETAQIAESYNKLYSQFSSTQFKDIGNYTIIKLIGEGAFGKVYLATHKLTHTKVVLKTGAKDDPNIVREVFYHRQFKHPNITRLYEVVLSEGMIWIVLEYCSSGELYDHVLQSGRIPVDEVRKLFAQIVSAVHYAHSLNCVHRDLKLENILLDKKNNAKISDFGFTRECQQRSLLETICGTTVYMSPELLEKKKYDGFKCDIWSLGIILYTMLYGHMPFDDDDEMKTQYKIMNEEPFYGMDIPEDAARLIQRILQKNPNDRPTAAEILNDPFLENEGIAHLESSELLLKNLRNNKMFHSKTERHLLKKLKSLGIDVHALQKSVTQKNCDSLAGLWELLLEKQKRKEAKRYRTRSSRSVLRITESTSRRVSQFIDTTPQLSRIVSSKSNITNRDTSLNEKSIRESSSLAQMSMRGSTTEEVSKFSSPEKRKNGFIQKFTKFWKINKKDSDGSQNSSLNNSNQHFTNGIANTQHKLNSSRSFSESHIYPNENLSGENNNKSNENHRHSISLQPAINFNLTNKQKDNNKKQLQLESNPSYNDSEKQQAVQLTIQEPKSPLRSNIKGRSRPMSLISQYSYASQATGMSDLSLDSNITTQSDVTATRPGFARKVSSDTSLHSRNTSARRSLSLISSNSSASERSSRKNSFYDYSSSDLKFTTISTPRGRKYNEGAIFPRPGGFRRKKSPLGGLPPSSKYKRNKPLIIEEEEGTEEEEEVGDDEVDELGTDIENIGLAESTRKSSDFEDDILYMSNRTK